LAAVVDVSRVDNEPLAGVLLQVIQLEEPGALEIHEADIELRGQTLTDRIGVVIDSPKLVVLADATQDLPADAVAVAGEVLSVPSRIRHAAGDLAVLVNCEAGAVPPRGRRGQVGQDAVLPQKRVPGACSARDLVSIVEVVRGREPQSRRDVHHAGRIAPEEPVRITHVAHADDVADVVNRIGATVSAKSAEVLGNPTIPADGTLRRLDGLKARAACDLAEVVDLPREAVRLAWQIREQRRPSAVGENPRAVGRACDPSGHVTVLIDPLGHEWGAGATRRPRYVLHLVTN
jgi:hypothetical protein